MGLTVGPVPARVDASVKAGICDLVDHAVVHGWSARSACRVLDVDDTRVARWAARRAAGEPLDDAPPGGNPLHGLLEWEADAIVQLFEQWGETDRSHRKLAHRGSRIGAVHVSPSTLQRVLLAKQLVLPGNPPREPTPRKPWPDWLEWKPNRIWGYDFTHFPRAQRAAVAIIDIVSRKWITTVCSAEESSTQVEIAFSRALEHEDLWHAADLAATDTLVKALVDGDAEVIDRAIADGDRPLLLAISDNGPQMRSHTTREFLAGVAIARQFGRPGVPQDQAWIETLFGHVKGEWPHLEKIRDGAELDAELARVQIRYNTVRLSAAIGYVTPCDEHEGRGDAIRQARRDGLARARADRIDYRRHLKETQP
ncbi:putative transposase OrfB (plasmid) [Mycobacterium intracellulare subsp. chimaera]|uniref:Putative transposase OrfB n=1 Tax=Mycobacterium intracellulare subsp. chimaera TaxID=222805 RepID=A0A7U5RYN2_MYCIT|nr:putative transposase OrfB [Mycobacterium intracellulare subsp. chimaera]ASL18221.1 putative transposase OrfB [Mycobacterium intracellulare subsp. chimaera]ASL18260.1 putative transposase OrfB [Mycobacterium intracellulare subsp. chimaera]ASL18295.1 putative transposase OrfB [Mycobacterium intracellulare subsp. chimaera]ASL18305.1 putative transposase OrfB [Mycobacterium intracellulare subsp. chimaera]